MRTNRLFVLAFALGLGLASCGGQNSSEAPSSPESGQSSSVHSDSSAINMAESYRQGREQFHAIVGVWLPELEDTEEVFSSFDPENQAARFDFGGDESLYASLKDYLVGIIGTFNHEDEYGVYWEFDAIVNGVSAKVNVEIGFYRNEGQFVISLHGFVRDYHTVTLSASAGGSVSLKIGNTEFENNIATVNAGDYLILSATPNNGFEFAGWYIGDDLLSTDNPYSYQAPAGNVTIQGRFAEESVQMTESYAAAKVAFSSATGIDLPSISDLDVDIAFGATYVMFDITGGSNLNHDAFEEFLAFLNGLSGWSGHEDEHSSEEYPTFVYSNASTGVSLQIVWNGESATGGIYLNVLSVLASFDAYDAAKGYMLKRSGITLPSLNGLHCDFSFAADSSWMTLDVTKSSDFSEMEYNQFLSALVAKMGVGENADDDFQKRTTWTVDELFWDIVWDLSTDISINFSDQSLK